MKNRDGGDYEGKKWDVYVYGDVNIDLVVPGVSSLPKPGQEDEVPVMDTYVGGGAALFALGIGKLGLHPVFQGEVGDDCYGELIRKEFAAKNIDDSLLGTSRTEKTGISISFTNEKDRSFLTYRGTNAGISIDKVDIEGVKNASFRRGNAVKLDFPDESFDAVTSNYVYHNITGVDKQALLLETPRVLKKGGAFAIHDLMSPRRYGDMQAFVQKLRDMGYERVELIDTTTGKFMTPKEACRLMLRGSTLLVGRK